MKDKLAALPSAQPEQCSDCIANGGDWECDHIHCHKGQLPSAQSERRKGKWNRLSYDTFHCYECGTTFIVMQGKDHMNFCPNCGSFNGGVG